ncbi:HNH endonuclease [Massilia sp. TS11]|uniref:HNH endonuclease n=1 Tax=Massilia sp. TS11 TaxID=2908003 RepID=UPI0035A3BA3D
MSQVARQCIVCRRKRVSETCGYCGKAFQHAPSRPRDACSRECAYALRGRASGAAQSNKVDLVCEECGRIRSVSPTYASRRYCSRACTAAARTGERSLTWKGGITTEHQAFYASKAWRDLCAEIWRRERGHCQRCRERCSTGEVHHIHTWVNRPDLRLEGSNLALLCVGCHKWVHSKRNTAREFLAPV